MRDFIARFIIFDALFFGIWATVAAIVAAPAVVTVPALSSVAAALTLSAYRADHPQKEARRHE